VELRTSSSIFACHHPQADSLNPTLAAAFDRLGVEDFERRSHFIGGRFENLYLKSERLPGTEQVLQFALEQARSVLKKRPAWIGGLLDSDRPDGGLLDDDLSLRVGFWLNAMEPGQQTSRHRHEENDELCSGVYYITAPDGSGDILFHDPPFETRVRPRTGMLLLFSPALDHSVEVNRSGARRLSLAFNIGPA
jgi:hypothetical protein